VTTRPAPPAGAVAPTTVARAASSSTAQTPPTVAPVACLARPAKSARAVSASEQPGETQIALPIADGGH
jgi:hypothetical protein